MKNWEQQQEEERIKAEKERFKEHHNYIKALDIWEYDMYPKGECVWNGIAMKTEDESDDTVDTVDAVAFDDQCKVLPEVDCIELCQWVSLDHIEYPMFAAAELKEEMALGVDVRAILNMKVSTLDLLLGVAFVLTASFAMHQFYRWCSERREYKRMEREEAAPLLVNVPAKV